MSRLELSIAWRYLRSRRGSRLLSLISVIAIGGVVVGVSALIVIIGVMNGLQNDLREKILVGSPDIRVLTYGEDMVMTDWQPVLAKVRRQPGVVAAGAVRAHARRWSTAGHKYMRGRVREGIPPDGPGVPAGDDASATHATAGDFSLRDDRRQAPRRGAREAARRAAERVRRASTRSRVITVPAAKSSPVTGMPMPRERAVRGHGHLRDGDVRVRQRVRRTSRSTSAQEFAQLGDAVTGIEVRTPTRWEAPRRRPAARRQRSAIRYRVLDWQQQNSSLFQALKLEKLGMTRDPAAHRARGGVQHRQHVDMVVTDKTRGDRHSARDGDAGASRFAGCSSRRGS